MKLWLNIFSLLTLLFTYTTSALAQETLLYYTGSWMWATGDDRLTLTLTQQGEHVSGYHFVSRASGGKVGGVSGGPGQLPSLSGEIHGPSAIMRFKSGTPGSQAYGHVRLTLRDPYLYWELMDSTSEHYLPQNAVLIRQK